MNKLKLLKQEDFDKLPKGIRGIPVWQAEKTGEIWPEPDNNQEIETENKINLTNTYYLS